MREPFATRKGSLSLCFLFSRLPLALTPNEVYGRCCRKETLSRSFARTRLSFGGKSSASVRLGTDPKGTSLLSCGALLGQDSLARGKSNANVDSDAHDIAHTKTNTMPILMPTPTLSVMSLQSCILNMLPRLYRAATSMGMLTSEASLRGVNLRRVPGLSCSPPTPSSK